MPKISSKLDLKKQLTTIKVTGEVTADEIVIGIRAHYNNKLTKFVLWDFREATVVSLATKDYEKIAGVALEVANSRKQGKIALVGDTNLNMGLGVMYRAIANKVGIPHEYKIFRDIYDAVQWLSSTI